MRKAFIEGLIEMADLDPKVRLLTADLGFTVVEKFAEAHPNKFLNVGAAEQNMMGVAMGMAAEGLTPWCYTISTFASMRGLEQIRHAAAQNLPIRVVGVGGGFAYGPAGFTHWGLEDVALMRALPNMWILAPTGPKNVRDSMRAFGFSQHPIYLRLGKGGEADVPDYIERNSKTLVLGLGTMAEMAEKLAEELGCNYSAVYSLSPLGFQGTPLSFMERVITIEEHFKHGGLFSAVAEEVAGYEKPPRIAPFFVPALKPGRIGSRQWLQKECGLSVDQIVKTIKEKS